MNNASYATARQTAPTFLCSEPHDADAVYARFAPDRTPIVETKDVAPNVTIHVDERGNPVGFEVRHVILRERRLTDYKHAAE